MATQSEAALEARIIATLQQMDYEYVQIVEDGNLHANFKRQLEVHNRKRLAKYGRIEFSFFKYDKNSCHLVNREHKTQLVYLHNTLFS